MIFVARGSACVWTLVPFSRHFSQLILHRRPPRLPELSVLGFLRRIKDGCTEGIKVSIMRSIWRWALRHTPPLRRSAIRRGDRKVLDEKAQASNGCFASRRIWAIQQSRKQRQRCWGVYIAKGLGCILLNQSARRGCEST